VDSNNNAHITWQDDRDGKNPEIYYKHSIGTTQPTLMPSPPTPGFEFVFAIIGVLAGIYLIRRRE